MTFCENVSDSMSSEGKENIVFDDTGEVFWIVNERIAKRSKNEIKYKVMCEGDEFVML